MSQSRLQDAHDIKKGIERAEYVKKGERPAADPPVANNELMELPLEIEALYEQTHISQRCLQDAHAAQVLSETISCASSAVWRAGAMSSPTDTPIIPTCGSNA